MKKCITILTMIVFAMIATQATAGLVDGDFQDDTLTRTGDPDAVNNLNTGWCEYWSASLESNAGNVYVKMPNTAQTDKAWSIGQVFSPTGLTGQQVVRFKYNIDLIHGDASIITNDIIWIKVYGIDHNTHAANDSIRVGNTIGSPGGHAHEILVESFSTPDETTGFTTLTTSSAFDPTSYPYFGITVGVTNIITRAGQGKEENMFIDDVELVPVPEPMLLGLLGLGILALVRRNR